MKQPYKRHNDNKNNPLEMVATGNEASYTPVRTFDLRKTSSTCYYCSVLLEHILKIQ